ncbi:P27 family phage terminase small subunit [Facklamia sp. P12937]|uniref:P27 family phage terminase small subunit n=1 Tax=Facklamia sp. P12937 TaxID=3421949 RepID=UPI003D16336F
MVVSVSKLKKSLMSRIDEDDLFEVEKIDRYCSLIALSRKLEKEIRKEGITKTTVNASQEFTKAHPALSELKSINSQINATGKSIKFKKVLNEKPKIVYDKKPKKVSLL